MCSMYPDIFYHSLYVCMLRSLCVYYDLYGSKAACSMKLESVFLQSLLLYFPDLNYKSSVTRWLDYFFNILPFAKIKIGPTA